MTMRTIVLPRLVGTRELARDLVNDAGVAGEGDTQAVLAARAVDVAATSFLDELVVALKEVGVKQLVLHGASDDLVSSLEERAAIHAPFDIRKPAA